MKITNITAIKCASLLASCVIRAWMSTLDIKIGFDDERYDPPRCKRPTVYLSWHEMMLFPTYTYMRFRMASLVSKHRDGELIANIVRMVRGSVIRGSTNQGRDRGGARAIREMMRRGHGRIAHLAILPDGPRGPRRVVQVGSIYLASRSAMPIVPCGFAYDNPWRLGSWDQMAIPKPFSKAVCLFGSPIEIPPNLGRDDLEKYRLQVQTAMDDVQERTERFVAGQGPDVKLFSKDKVLNWP